MNSTLLNKIILILLIIVVIVFTLIWGFKLLVIWLPFLIAWFISNLLSPLVKKIHKKTKINSTLLTFVILLLFIGINLFIISLIGYIIITQASILLDKFPEISALAEKAILNISMQMINLTDNIPNYLSNNLDFDIPSILENINLSITTILASLVGVVAFIPNLLVSIIVMFVATFFMTKDKDKLKNFEMSIFSNKIFRHKLMIILKEDIIMVLLGYIKAQLILMTITFSEVAIGLTLLKIPYAIIIALGIGILDALPVFGTGTVFIPWVIILLFYKSYSLAIGIFIVYLIATLGRQALEPKIISTQIGIYPLVTLIIIYTGIKIFGVTGIIIAPLIAISILAIKKSEILQIK